MVAYKKYEKKGGEFLSKVFTNVFIEEYLKYSCKC